ncbi:MAG: response regulator transcription factor [Flavobacteriales bacterium]|nr:response regulator transcription factor [Flavobacteriales bacterium]MBP9079929.1 response regulator transcription factor [Flavobacteriales bacterium]
MQRIRVILFDDNKDLREMFRLLVDAQPDMVCVSAHPDLSQLLRDIGAAKPDVIVMDIQMPGLNGIEGVRLVKARWPDARVLMQTVFDDDARVFEAIRAGASGYILKSSSADEMMKAVRDVHAGGSAMTPAIAAKVLAFFHQGSPAWRGKTDAGLSDREKEVLLRLVDGRSYKMIAADLAISYHTVNTHIRHIYEKLHVCSSTEAVSKALKNGLV